MATLPPDPYGPDPVHNPDGTTTPGHPGSLPGPDNTEPPKLHPEDSDALPVNAPPASTF